MTVAVADNTNPPAEREVICENPFERAPCRVHFYGRLDEWVVVVKYIRVTSADVGVHHGIFILEAFIEIRQRMAVGFHVGAVFKQCVRTAADLATFMPEEDVVITTNGGVSRPLIARENDKPSGFVERAGEIVQLFPERNVHLEVVSLMAGDIEECFVSGEVEVAFDAIDANRFAGLTVEIAPESGDIALPDDERPGFRNLGVVDQYVDT